MRPLERITREGLSRLSDEEAREYLELLELQYAEVRRQDICEYAQFVEVPGTPAPMAEGDRIAMLKAKEAARRVQTEDGPAWEIDEPELAAENEQEWYPRQLKVFKHHRLILRTAQGLMEEEVVTGPLANGHDGIVPDGAMLFMPPGSAKSSYASVVVPSYCMGRWPGTDVIGVSYGSELAKRFGRRVRHICRSQRFSGLWSYKGEPISVSQDNQAVDQWSLTNGSTYRAVGVFGGLTGNRADLICPDDPIAGREEAESEIIREKTFAAFSDDLFSRLKPRGKVLLSMTRWHEDDPAGRLLGEDWEGQSGLWLGTDGRWWLVLCCPYLADALDDPLGRQLGERIWPEWFDDRHEDLARASGDRTWQSLYQQKPSASEGVILLKKFWRCWPHGKAEPDPAQLENPEETEPPKNWAQCVLVYDTAFEDGQDNDYSAMTAWASFGRRPPIGKRLGPRGDEEQQNLLLLGGDRAKLSAVDLFKWVTGHIEFFRPDWIIVEKKASGIQLLQELRRARPRWEDLGQVHYVNIIEWTPPFPPAASGKVPRAHSAAVLMERGTVWYMPGGKSEAIIRECAALPNGRHDDWADTVTCMLIWSRDASLLEMPGDVLDKAEEEEAEREDKEFWDSSRTLYGHNKLASDYGTARVRSLYGRAPKSTRYAEDRE